FDELVRDCSPPDIDLTQLSYGQLRATTGDYRRFVFESDTFDVVLTTTARFSLTESKRLAQI
ncbi:MAG: hypothetical protein P4L81_06260, partial [Candidatus Pacebacteria bacterium]|nr:hypothetical protein [Candidatus Paceibacterota bacterium]